MKFNMGCGRRKIPGFINVDAQSQCDPDEVFDLEKTPWPWPDNCADEVQFIHALEHMGGDPQVFLEIVQEVYRISAPDCRIVVKVPHPRHDNFISDPTHVRPITPDTWRLFDCELNDQALSAGGSNTPLGRYLGVDLVLEEHGITLEEPFWSQYQRGEITNQTIEQLLRERNNIAREFSFVLRARKPMASQPV